MSQQGWIKIHRQIRECWLWDDKPFDRTHAWIDLLLKANHSDKKVALGTELIEVKRGSFITSELKLMDEWGWSKTKLRNFLKLLKEDGMIEIITDRKKTTINIVNYSVYQESENHEKTTEEPQEDHEKTNKRPIKDTNKNEKNEKNEKKLFLSDSNEYRLAEYLYKYMLTNNESAKQPNYQAWSKEFDYILRIDKRDIEELKKVIRFAQTDTFWKTNILSPKSLRDKYEQLVLKMKNQAVKPTDIKPQYKIV